MDETQIPGLIRKQHGALVKMATPQESDLGLIQGLAERGATITAEDVLIGSAKLAHDQYDRSSERFTPEYLQRFAETLPGKALLEGHDYSKSPQGRWYDANVQQDANGTALVAKFYVKAKSAIAEDIRLGIAKDVSIGFKPDKLICDMCNEPVWGAKSDCSHFPGQEYDGKLATATYGGDIRKVEALEGSLVWLGCQPGAQVMGQSSPLYERKMALAQAAAQGDDMELKEALAEIERLKAELTAAGKFQKTAEQYEAHLRSEIARKTKVKELAQTRDEKAAERASAFVQKMSASASVEQLEEMSADLDEQLKTVVATKATATPLDDKREDEPARKAGFGPQRRVMG